MKKEAKKAEKESTGKFKDLEAELNRYQIELKKQVEENTRLAETNRTLMQLQNAKDNLEKVQKPVQLESEVDDVEFVQFFAEQNASRGSR